MRLRTMPEGQVTARRVLSPAEIRCCPLLHGGVTLALALVARENFTRWDRGTYLTLTIAPGYLRTLAQGLPSDLYNVSSNGTLGPNKPTSPKKKLSHILYGMVP